MVVRPLICSLITLFVLTCGSVAVAQQAPKAAAETPNAAPKTTEQPKPTAKPAPAPKVSTPAPAAQQGTIRPVPDFALRTENDARARTNRLGSLVLGGWALFNFGWATYGLLKNSDNPKRAFFLTNAAWNFANGLVAVSAYFANKKSAGDGDLLDTLQRDQATETFYAVATALDVGFVFAGAWLGARGKLKHNNGLLGTGRAVMLQGAFLFGFDSTMFTLHRIRRHAFETAHLPTRD